MSRSGNSFAALSGCEERDPKRLLKKGNQKPTGTPASSHQLQLQVPAGSRSNNNQLTVRTQTPGNSKPEEEPLSPGLAEALAAIERAEQAGRAQWGALASAASPMDGTNRTAHDRSAQQSPSNQSFYSTSSLENTVDNDPWLLPPQLLCLSAQKQFAGSAEQQQQRRQQQPQQQPNSRCGSSFDVSRAAPSPAVPHMLDASALLWQQFACEFAATASASGDLEAAAGATDFSEQIAAGFLLSDSATAAALAAAVKQAEDAGLSTMEVIAAQQKALMLEAEAAASAAAAAAAAAVISSDQGCSTGQQSWAKAVTKLGSSQLLPGPGSPSTPVQLQQRQCISSATSSAVELDSDFPVLAGSTTGCPSPQKSPYSIPRGWKGGRLAPKAKGIRVLNSGSSSSSTLRPSSLDLHWDLALDGLRLKEEVELPLELQCALTDAEAAEATRWLVEQQAAEAARGGTGDRLSQDTVRSMMEKTAAPAAAAAAAAAAAVQGHGSDDGSEPAAAGSRHCGRDFRQMWAYMLSTGWVPVPKREGGGGTHFKFRRTLPISGIVQTLVHASSPSDSQRGERNVAAQIARLDRQAREVEDAARAAAAAARAAAGGSTAPARSCSSKCK